MKQVLDEHATSLTDIVGVGPVLAACVLAACVLAGTRDPRRFPTAAAYANYTGTAPARVASGDYNRHRLSRYGNRDLNSALRDSGAALMSVGVSTPSLRSRAVRIRPGP